MLTLFYSLLELRSSECDVVSLYVVCCSVHVSVCFVYCVFDSVLFLADTCLSEVHPVFNLLRIIADIANPDSFV